MQGSTLSQTDFERLDLKSDPNWPGCTGSRRPESQLKNHTSYSMVRPAWPTQHLWPDCGCLFAAHALRVQSLPTANQQMLLVLSRFAYSVSA